MVVHKERVAVERELGSGQGDIMTKIPNSNQPFYSLKYDIGLCMKQKLLE